MTTRPRILLAGPLPLDGDVVGGTKVSFAAMALALEREPSLDVDVHDISRPRAGHGHVRRVFGEAGTLTSLLTRILRGRHDVVMLNTSSGGLLKSGALVSMACRMRDVPLMIRVFGGDLDLFIDSAPGVLRRLAEGKTLRADRVLLQTHALCERFRTTDDCCRVRWWPTTRDVIGPARERSTRARRFLFVGQLRKEKGVTEAIEASHRLPAGASLTIVGPSMNGFDIADHDLGERCTYEGSVPHDDVAAIMAEHDVLVFPTYHAGEGMPGIVLEAMQSGLPVVATRWRSIPELVEDGENGILVAPRNADGLGAALQRVAESDELFRRIQSGARITGERFRARHWEPKLVQWIHDVADGHVAPATDSTAHVPDDSAHVHGNGSAPAAAPRGRAAS